MTTRENRSKYGFRPKHAIRISRSLSLCPRKRYLPESRCRKMVCHPIRFNVDVSMFSRFREGVNNLSCGSSGTQYLVSLLWVCPFEEKPLLFHLKRIPLNTHPGCSICLLEISTLTKRQQRSILIGSNGSTDLPTISPWLSREPPGGIADTRNVARILLALWQEGAASWQKHRLKLGQNCQ